MVWSVLSLRVQGRKPCAAVVGFLIAACFVTSSAHAGLFGDDEARRAILELREQRVKDQEAVSMLTEQIGRLSRSLLDTNNQLEALRAEMAKLRGQSELFLKDQSDMLQRQKDQQLAWEQRMTKLEPKDIALDGKSFKAAPDEVARFDQALALLRAADFAGALTQFDTLLNEYPTTGYLESVLYWQGNAHYGLGACKPAMEAFRKLLAASPQHQRAPEAMLSVANCHAELKEASQAKQLLQTLVKTYPDSEAALVARERLAPVPVPATSSSKAAVKSK